MNTDIQGNGVRGSLKGIWDDRWVRFKLALTQRGVEVRSHNFYRAWVLGFIRFLKPRAFAESGAGDVKEFLSKLGKEGKGAWQLTAGGGGVEKCGQCAYS